MSDVCEYREKSAVNNCDKENESEVIGECERRSIDDKIDPRIQIELENLNTLTELINTYEVQLDEARNQFRQSLSEASQKINIMSKRLGACIEKSRPYYEAKISAKEFQNETQKAALKFERASSAHLAAKEMVSLAEEGLQKEGRIFDPVWQEMLNHATNRVNATEYERVLSEREHLKTSKAYNEAEQLVAKLHKQLKRHIVKARPYFEMKAQFNQMLDEQIQNIKQLECKVSKAKLNYSNALHRLEDISDEIHERRKLLSGSHHHTSLEKRGVGVGAESPVIASSPRLSAHFRELKLNSTAVESLPVVGLPYFAPSSNNGSEVDECESIASLDTNDTLDDATIENLMLEKTLESELRKIEDTFASK
ncbi:SH3 domain-binding protein 5-like protein [Dinothrombium tinctorium]|uniref:SH3 domain-binding protein 5-like n=1 Tax=Dinothrombium tinctorium TaxID=1965070 RepID=A0A3S3NX67_9ACAR|nr:SH3 domain-binding protein 5-like protein [Dinothrombium tinctorium]RWS10404.1 SH3 domain-binding protein 5-like protein [Dinothrombium tinctorium]RWS17712.1 SH3 domain-binding protein 5-like protein [Dinothrombium tinctorium]